MDLLNLFKSNEKKIIEIREKEENNFFDFKFNNFINTHSKEELYKICQNYLEQEKKSEFLIQELKQLVIYNNEIVRITRKFNDYFQNETDINIIKAAIEFKNSYHNSEKLINDFDREFDNFNIMIEKYKSDTIKVNNEIENINKFNLYVNLQQKIFIEDDEFKILPLNEKNEMVLEICIKAEKYIEIVNSLNDFMENDYYLPYDERFIEFKNYWINEYRVLSFEDFNPSIYIRYKKDEQILIDLVTISRRIKEYQKDIRDSLNEFFARITVNKLLEDLFNIQISDVENKYKELGKLYQSQQIQYEELIQKYIDLKDNIRDINTKYVNLLSPIKNTTNMLGITDESDIQDICDYYIYSLSKTIERKMHAYGTSKNITEEEVNKFIGRIEEKLYILTNDQKKAIIEGVGYLNQEYTANCLIQGDVSSGKTIVTVALMFILALKNMKSVYIVPRRVLRLQHLKTLRDYNELFNLDLKIYDASEDFDIKEADIVLNGYSFNDNKFSETIFDLGIIDEIQLFGVDQRNAVQRKYPDIDMFYTTATPHPRTKLISLIGNMDIIEIKEMPPGRKLKNTKAFSNFEEEHYNRVNSEVEKGNMVLVVCPLVRKQGMTYFESLPTAFLKYKDMFPSLKVEQLRAEYSETRKEEIISASVSGEIDILVATKSIEVGIDIPRASVIFIHYPHVMKIKWGVSQLHQLRGRIGRSNQDSYCYIEAPKEFEENSPIGSVLKTQDVFELTKNDFNWRGFEKIIGTKQSGNSGSKSSQEKRIKAYELIAKSTPKLISSMEEEFIKKIEDSLNDERIENLN